MNAITTRPTDRNTFAAMLAEHYRNGEYPPAYDPMELHPSRHVELRSILYRAAYRHTRDHDAADELASHYYFAWLTRDYASIPQGPRYVFRGDHAHAARSILKLAKRHRWMPRRGGLQGRPAAWPVDHDGNATDDGADRRTVGRYRRRFRLNDRELMERRAASIDPAMAAMILENSTGYRHADGMERLGITGETAADILRLSTWGTPATRAAYSAMLTEEDREKARQDRRWALNSHRRRRRREASREDTGTAYTPAHMASRAKRRRAAARAAAARRQSARVE